jgi:hypothetical protein
MNISKKLFQGLTGILLAVAIVACDDLWNEHYREAALKTDGTVELFSGSVSDFLSSQPELSTINALFENAGVKTKLKDGQEYTVIVYPNAILNASIYKDSTSYANYCICNNSISPATITDGLGFHSWKDKVIWFNVDGDTTKLDDYHIQKIIKTDNAYVYYISEGVIPVRQSVYDILNNLGSDYSTFKTLVKQYEEVYFDPTINKEIGTNAQGNTVYEDSIWSVRNTLMDRYTAKGAVVWNMRSDDYATTMMVPSNALIKSTIDSAMAKIPVWLGRPATADDRLKFQKWIVRSCFYSKRIKPEEVTGPADLYGVGDYMKVVQGDDISYMFSEPTIWRPSVQAVDPNVMAASNGNIYFINKLKIPNYIVINRVKTRFYQLWDNMSVEDRNKHFTWSHWADPMEFEYSMTTVIDGQTMNGFWVSKSLPPVFYNYLTAIPDAAARRDTLTCSVTYDGVLFNEANGKMTECNLPAGEYYLRMGFQNNLMYSLSIQFNGKYLAKDMVMWAQGANFHFDRSSADFLDENGRTNVGYPDGYDPSYWAVYTSKAYAYDTDGYQVGVVTIPKDGNFKITVSSSDMSRLYPSSLVRDASNNYQLKMYHWCLRPTKNNY